MKELRLKHLNGSNGTREENYKCLKCRDRGYYEFEQDGYSFIRACECEKAQRDRLESRLKFAAIPRELAGQTIDSFRTDCYSTEQNRSLAEMAKSLAAQYIKNFPKIREIGKGLYFHSAVKGSGKTRLAVSIANDLITKQAVSVKFATTIQILDQIRNTYGDRNGWGISEQELTNQIISVPVLVIDDIGAEQSKDWVNERFYNILNGRMIEKRITIFTSNYRINELKLDERIVNRIEKMALPIEFPDESIRRMIAQSENNKLMDCLLGM